MRGQGGSGGKQGQEDGQCGQAAQASSVGVVFLCAGHWFYSHHSIYQIVFCNQPWWICTSLMQDELDDRPGFASQACVLHI